MNTQKVLMINSAHSKYSINAKSSSTGLGLGGGGEGRKPKHN